MIAPPIGDDAVGEQDEIVGVLPAVDDHLSEALALEAGLGHWSPPTDAVRVAGRWVSAIGW
ncbi:MAG: hypothetical protein U9R72_16825 [Chloroflexota bacterium]|nr:hypothetical protein [Chloroflexota bacterium]